MVSVVTTAIATMAIVIVLSVFNGFRQVAIKNYSKLAPPYVLNRTDGRFFDADSLLNLVSADLKDVDVERVAETQAYFYASGYEAVGHLRGVNNTYLQRIEASDKVLDGVPFVGDTLGVNIAVLGQGLARGLHVAAGDIIPVEVMIPRRKGRINAGSIISSFRTDSIYAGATFKVENPALDDEMLIADIDFVRSLTGLGESEVSDLYLYPKGDFSTSNLNKTLASSGFQLLDLPHQNSETLKVINIEKWVSFSLLAFILLIASFNIISTLTMLIIEKKGNMSILRSMGSTVGRIRLIFVWEGVLLALFGAISGSILGLLLSLGQQKFGWIKLSSDIDPSVTAVNVYPVAIDFNDFFVVLGLVILLSVFTTLISLSTFSNKEVKSTL